MKKTKKFGFSMVEGLILLVVAAIAIAAMTPIITRKIVNVSDVGATLGGANHGRYEYYTKEYLIFGDNPDKKYEKVLDNDKNNSNTPKVLIYEKVIDNDTETVYEELTGLKPLDPDKNGVVSEATGYPKGENSKNKDKQITFKRSNKYIFEDGKITYKITDKNGKEKNPKFDPNKNRIIESKLTTKKPEKSKDNNNLWIVKKDSPEYKDVKVDTAPWERLFSGSHEVYDRKVEKDPARPDEPLHATFKLPDNATDIVIHAVGGGGAGGGLSEDSLKNSWATTEDIDSSKITPERKKELEAMKKRLQEKFKGLGYVTLDFANDGIEVTIDVREGHDGQYIFPDFFEYTDHLGAGTQKPDIFKMPNWWFNWNTIYNSGYETGAVACGGAGGKGGDLKWKTNNTTNDYISGMKTAFGFSGDLGKFKKVEKTGTCSDSWSEFEGYPSVTGVCSSGSLNSSGTKCYSSKSCDKEYTTKVNCSLNYNPTYIDCGTYSNGYSEDFTNSSCGNKCSITDAKCPSDLSCKRNSTWYEHNYYGGAGGEAPPCVLVRQKVSAPIPVEIPCSGAGVAGSSQTTTAPSGSLLPVGTSDGTAGATCVAIVGSQRGVSAGGTGGKSCVQRQIGKTVTLFAAKILLADGTSPQGAQTSGGKTTSEDPQKTDGAEIVDFYQGVTGADASTAFNYSAETTEQLDLQATAEWNDAYKEVYKRAQSFCQKQGLPKEAVPDIAGYLYKYSGLMSAEAGTGKYLGTRIDEAGGEVDVISKWHLSGDQISELMMEVNYVRLDSRITGYYILDDDFMITATPNTNCGQAGQAGSASGGTTFQEGSSSNKLPAGFGSSHGIYNEKYTWVIPYGTKYLSYGEAGEPGNYATTKVSKVSGERKIELFIGQGGQWKDDGWKQGKNGPNGTDTYIKINGREVLRAKGGKGGKGALNTSKYDMCFKANENKSCKDSNGNNVTCCSDTRTTKEVKNTMSRPSAFENIKSFVQNSTIIGIGLGRGAEGAGSTGGNDFLLGEIKVYNNTGSAGRQKKVDLATVLNVAGSALKTEPLSATNKEGYYQPKAMEIQALSYKGGDGGVIITW